MSDQPEELRLADELDTTGRPGGLCGASATVLRRQHSRIDADEALMRTAMEAMAMALHEMCHKVAPRFSFTAAVDGLDANITALRERLESSK